VVIDPGHGLELAAIGQPDPTHDVQLPQLHWPGPLPAPVVSLPASPCLGLDEPVADQGPVDARQPGRWIHAGAGKLVGEAALTPAWMAPAELAQAGLDLGGHLVRAGVGAVGAVGQGVQPAGAVAAQPAVDGLATDTVAVGDLDHRESVAQHLHDGVEALLCHCELHEHAPDLLASPLIGEAEEGRAVVSTINRNSEPISRHQHDKHQPDQHSQARMVVVSNLSARQPCDAVRSRMSPRLVSADELGRCGAKHGAGEQRVGAALASHGRGHRCEPLTARSSR
jgi:hypothetical protein